MERHESAPEVRELPIDDLTQLGHQALKAFDAGDEIVTHP